MASAAVAVVAVAAATVSRKLRAKPPKPVKATKAPRAARKAATKPAKNLPPVKFATYDSVYRGMWSIALGNPYGMSGVGEMCMSVGIVSALDRSLPKLASQENRYYANLIQTTAEINPGNSGGPLFNLRGEVVGMDTAILSPTGSSVGIGFAVPANELQPALAQIERYGEIRRGHIGVRVEDVPDEVAAKLHLDKPNGALVADVTGGGPADLTHVLSTLGIRYLRLDQLNMAMASIVCALPLVLPLVYFMMKRLSR